MTTRSNFSAEPDDVDPDAGRRPPDGHNVIQIEITVLRLLARGFQSKEIADIIGKKRPTVEGYIRMLYAKLGAKSRAHLVARAYDCGLLAPEKIRLK